MATFLDIPSNAAITISGGTFVEGKNYRNIIFQGIGKRPVLDTELNELQEYNNNRQSELLKLLGNLFIGDGFKIIEDISNNINNFKIKTGRGFFKNDFVYLPIDKTYVSQSDVADSILRQFYWNSNIAMPALTTPDVARNDLVVLNLVIKEIFGADDIEIINPNLNRETAARSKIFIGITVLENYAEYPDYSNFLNRFTYENNEYCFRIPLAWLNRDASENITKAMIEDIRFRRITSDIFEGIEESNSDKVDGRDVDDSKTDNASLWTAEKIIEYIRLYVKGLDPQANVLDILTGVQIDALVSPTEGDRYICNTTGSGFTINTIYQRHNGAWEATTPNDGFYLKNSADNNFYIYDSDNAAAFKWIDIGKFVSHADLEGLNIVVPNGADGSTYKHLTDTQVGNATGKIPISNGTLNVNLNADKVDGYDIYDDDAVQGDLVAFDKTGKKLVKGTNTAMPATTLKVVNMDNLLKNADFSLNTDAFNFKYWTVYGVSSGGSVYNSEYGNRILLYRPGTNSNPVLSQTIDLSGFRMLSESDFYNNLTRYISLCLFLKREGEGSGVTVSIDVYDSTQTLLGTVSTVFYPTTAGEWFSYTFDMQSISGWTTAVYTMKFNLTFNIGQYYIYPISLNFGQYPVAFQKKQDLITAPYSAVVDNISLFDNTYGNKLKDSGTKLSDFVNITGTQTISGVKYFSAGLKTTKIYPDVNSTTAILVTKADGTSVLMGFDTTNARIGIHYSDPQTMLEIQANAHISRYGSNPYLSFVRANGTRASATAVVSGDLLGAVNFEGYTDTTFANRETGAFIGAYASAAWSPTEKSALLAFFTTNVTTSAERMRITADGKVGIGVTPVGKFHVKDATGGFFGLNIGPTEVVNNVHFTIAPYRSGGTSYVNLLNPSVTDNIALSFYNTDNTEYSTILRSATEFRIGGGNTVRDTVFYDGLSTEILRIVSGSKGVSIGTDNIYTAETTELLRLRKSLTTSRIYDLLVLDTYDAKDTTAGDGPAILFRIPNESGTDLSSNAGRIAVVKSSGFSGDTSPNADMAFFTAPTTGTPLERMRIFHNGNITVSPAITSIGARLDSSLNFTLMNVGTNSNLGITAYNTVGTYSALLTFRSFRGLYKAATATQSGDVLGKLLFQGYAANSVANGAAIYAVASAEWGTSGDTTDSPADLVFSTVSDGDSTLIERMRIASEGQTTFFNNVIQDRDTITSHVFYSYNTSNNHNFLLGYAARGTKASPLTLAADDDIIAVAGYQYNGTAWVASKRVSMQMKASEIPTTSANGTKIDFYTTPNGTTATALALTIGNDGSLTAANKLTVNAGGASITGGIELLGQTLIGSKSGSALYNTQIGYRAGASLIAGYENIAIGSNALYATTGGYYNIAIGKSTLRTITTNYDNVAIGKTALMNLPATRGNANVAIGSGAGLCKAGATDVITGNVCLGYNSGYNLYNGAVHNIFIGATSGYCASGLGMVGIHNVGIGYQSLHNIEIGDNNVVIGRQSGLYLRSSDNNVLVGGLSGSGDSIYGPGKENVCVGFKSGFLLNQTSTPATGAGALNTLLGSYAGQYITTGRNNIFIGNDAGSSFTTETHNIVIGELAGVAGSSIGTYIANIYGTTVTAGVRNVYIDSTGKLGGLSSSLRYKENVYDVGTVLDKVMLLKPVHYSFITDPNKESRYGLIAEWTYEVFSDFVFYKDGQIEGVNYDYLPIVLLKAIQEQQYYLEGNKKELEELKARVLLLESKIA